MSRSEFRIRDLMHHDSPVSLYIVTQPTDKACLRPLVRVLVNMIVRQLADRVSFENGRPVARYSAPPADDARRAPLQVKSGHHAGVPWASWRATASSSAT